MTRHAPRKLTRADQKAAATMLICGASDEAFARLTAESVAKSYGVPVAWAEEMLRERGR